MDMLISIWRSTLVADASWPLQGLWPTVGRPGIFSWFDESAKCTEWEPIRQESAGVWVACASQSVKLSIKFRASHTDGTLRRLNANCSTKKEEVCVCITFLMEEINQPSTEEDIRLFTTFHLFGQNRWERKYKHFEIQCNDSIVKIELKSMDNSQIKMLMMTVSLHTNNYPSLTPYSHSQSKILLYYILFLPHLSEFWWKCATI